MGEHLQGRGKPIAGRGYWLLLLAITFSCVAGAAATRPATDAKGTPRYRFDGNTVLDLARRTAGSAFVPKRLDNPALQQLSYDQYRDIRFNAGSGDLAQRAGAVPHRAVPRRVPCSRHRSRFRSSKAASRSDVADRGRQRSRSGRIGCEAAGQPARCRCRAFASARCSTRARSGTSSWCSRAPRTSARSPRDTATTACRPAALRSAPRIPPAKNSRRSRISGSSGRAPMRPAIVVHALLDSPSTTGAYRFSVTPGAETVMDVDVTLFPRVDAGQHRHRAADLDVPVR